MSPATAFPTAFRGVSALASGIEGETGALLVRSILGEDGKPFKNALGRGCELADLLDEARNALSTSVSKKKQRATRIERLPESELPRLLCCGSSGDQICRSPAGIASDYVFSWDKMLALQGNTAVYLLYG